MDSRSIGIHKKNWNYVALKTAIDSKFGMQSWIWHLFRFSHLQASLQKFLDGSHSGSVAKHGQLDWLVRDARFYVFRCLMISRKLQLKRLVVLISSFHAFQKIDIFIHITVTGGWIQTIYIHSSRHGYCKCRTSTHCENQSIFLGCLWLCILDVYLLAILCKLNPKSASCTKIKIPGPKRLDRKCSGLDWSSAVISNDLMNLCLFITCNFRFLGSNLIYGAFPNVTTTQLQILYVLLCPVN